MARFSTLWPLALALALATAACSSDDDSGSTQDVTAPGFVGSPFLIPNPNPAVPLAARITLTTDEPAQVRLQIDDGVSSWEVTPDPAFLTAHEVPVLGLRFDRTHLITVVAADPSGNEASSGPLTFTTPMPPDPFPPIVVLATDPARMEPGVTLFNTRVTDPALTSPWGMLVIVDEAGEPIWTFEAPHQIDYARRLPNGNLIYMYDRLGITEIDMFGEVVAQWWAANLAPNDAPPGAVLVPTDTFHHDVIPMPPGSGSDFAALGTELRVLFDYPASEDDLSQLQPEANVIGDLIVEFRRDGTITNEVSLLDVLDPYRIAYGSLGPFWNATYDSLVNGGPTADWSHANAVVYDESDDTWIVSARAQDAIVKLAREVDPIDPLAALDWILGPHGNWTLPWTDFLLDPIEDPAKLAQGYAPFEWPYHGHAPQLLGNGELMYFDNGNFRALPPDPKMPIEDSYSRAVRFAVDEAAKTVEQLWIYGGPDNPGGAQTWYSGFLGDADVLPQTGNVLVADGGKSDGQQLWGRVVEVTQTMEPEVVFELEVREPVINGIGWTIYRAERLPGVYP